MQQAHSRVTEAEVVTGCCVGKVVFIPRINSTNTALPVSLKAISSQIGDQQGARADPR